MHHHSALRRDKGTHWSHKHRTLEELGRDTTLPSYVDLRPNFDAVDIEVYDQGHLNSCTANALSQIWRYAQSRVDPGFNPSRLFIYYNERSAEGTASQDSGAYLSDGCRSLKTYGVCSEWTWPYEESNEPVKPPQDAYDEALDHIIHTPCQLSSNLSTLKDSLAQEKPFVVGISVYEEFLSDHATKYGNVEMPGPGSQHKFNHAVTCVGYDDGAQEWIFRNSWGPDWGCNGHFFLPYEYLEKDEHLASDFWNVSTDWQEGED